MKEVENGWLAWVFLAIAVLGVVFAFVPQECDIDAIYLYCRVKGSVGDWLGGLLWMAGPVINLWRTYNPTYADSRGDGNWKSALPIILMAVGAILVWNL
jgi:hypothetical protein